MADLTTASEAASAAGPIGVLIASAAAVIIAWIKRPQPKAPSAATTCADALREVLRHIDARLDAHERANGEQLGRIERDTVAIRAAKGGRA